MVQFTVRINNGVYEDTIKAKYVGNGAYLVNKLKTGNKLDIHWIHTKVDNNGKMTYAIAALYPTSVLHNTTIVSQDIYRSDDREEAVKCV